MTTDTAALLDRFTREAERTDARVRELAGWDAVAELAIELSEGGRIAIAPSVPEAEVLLVMLGAAAFIPSDGDAIASAADVAVGIVRGRAAVAETGSVLLFEETLADRAVSMLTRNLIEVVSREDLIPDLFALKPLLAPDGAWAPRYAALVTGPSRTADIERSLTIGVQGPATVHVVVLP
jgi:L-lactate dehydrogenase complex protein LldG